MSIVSVGHYEVYIVNNNFINCTLFIYNNSSSSNNTHITKMTLL